MGQMSHRRHTKLRQTLLAAICTLTLGAGAPAWAEDAVAAVARIYATTLHTASSPAALTQALAADVSIAAVAAKVLGPPYTNAPAAQRADFDRVLLKVIALELHHKLSADVTFEILRSRALQTGDVVVFSRLTRRNGSEKLLDWKMRPCGARFCIYDLLGNNASYTAALRKDMGRRLAALNGSVAALTESLVAELAQQG